VTWSCDTKSVWMPNTYNKKNIQVLCKTFVSCHIIKGSYNSFAPKPSNNYYNYVFLQLSFMCVTQPDCRKVLSNRWVNVIVSPVPCWRAQQADTETCRPSGSHSGSVWHPRGATHTGKTGVENFDYREHRRNKETMYDKANKARRDVVFNLSMYIAYFKVVLDFHYT